MKITVFPQRRLVEGAASRRRASGVLWGRNYDYKEEDMRRLLMLSTILVALCAGALNLIGGSSKVNAMPNFSRKLGVPCTTCHTTIPRLNEVGYKFRAAGFRLPDRIGKEEEKSFELGDYFSGRIQARYDTQVTNQPNGAAQANVLRSELSFSPEDVFEVENAYVRFVKGNENKFFTARAGVFHPWEGFGASDRPVSNVRPLYQTNPISAGGRAVPYVYQPWGLDEVGLEVGGEIDKLSVRAAILGGTFMRWEDESKAFIPFPAQTGPWKGANQAVAALGKPFDSPAHNTPDFSAIATYLLHPEGGGISVLYYRGNIATPTGCTDGTKIGQTNPATGEVCGVTAPTPAEPFGTIGNTDFDFSKDTAFRNNFDRYAAYASYPIAKKFLPAAGFNYGRDTNPNGTKFNSKGAFVEGTYSFNQYASAGVRYDWYRPRYPAPNTQWAITPYVNIPLQNGLQFIAEYQHRDFEVNAANHRQNDTFQFRVIFIK